MTRIKAKTKRRPKVRPGTYFTVKTLGFRKGERVQNTRSKKFGYFSGEGLYDSEYLVVFIARRQNLSISRQRTSWLLKNIRRFPKQMMHGVRVYRNV